MAIIKCKMCGGDLEIAAGTSVAECEYCGTKQTLPKVNDEVIQNLFNRANNLRIKCEFDKAEQIYEKILLENDSEAEAHWGIVLCKYGIEYVEDPKTFKRIPTCHRTSYDAVTTDADYLAAIAQADASQRSIYEEEARAIDHIQKNILNIVKNESPFDVFLCYKETDENGKRTVDSTIANDIYYQLTQEGMKVFYAAITLEDKLGQEYEPYIFAALSSSKVMLVIGTKPQYFSAVWVKNEWSRFLKLMKTDRSKLLIPCYKDMDAYDLPEEFAHLQAQDMGKIGFINDVVRGIKKVAAVEKTVVKETMTATGNTKIPPLLERAFMFLEDGDWDSANEYCEKVLDLDPKNSRAYLGKMLAEFRVNKEEHLQNCANPFHNSNNYKKLMRFADEKTQAVFEGYLASINARNEALRVEGIYNRAQHALDCARTKADYYKAARQFETIADYKDSAEQIKLCHRRIKEIEDQEERTRLYQASLAEQERLKKARQAKIARQREEARRKKNKMVALGVGAILCVAIAIVILVTAVIIPNSKYNNAVELIDKGEYVEAYEILVALDGYKDSAEKAKSIYYEYKLEKLKTAIVGEVVTLGVYEQNLQTDGKEDIEWIVLKREESRVLLISKYALDYQPYHHTKVENITWDVCSLRNWMNGTFMDNAFSDEERAIIATTTIPTEDGGYNVGQAVQDQVFLLNYKEINEYVDDENCTATEYAQELGASGYRCLWMQRAVYPDGGADDFIPLFGSSGETSCTVENKAAIRPALWVDVG